MDTVALGGGVAEGRTNKRSRVKTSGGADPEPDAKRRAAATPAALAVTPWAQQHPASRIYRVSRASGGKDRHSKVYTAKGIRDRRVRLSVATAIQFYDLQDRLGYDQPSKAIEWLIKAAAAAIDKLPSLESATGGGGAGGFPAIPASAVAAAAGAKDHGSSPPDADADAAPDADHHQQQLTRSGCSSTSETSKGSVLSLSRSESRVKARERARERSAAARDKDKDPAAAADDDAATTGRRAAATTASAQAASFTELLTGMAAATAAAEHKPQQQQQSPAPWPPTADYIGFAQPRKAAGTHGMAHAFASPAPHLGGIAASIAMAPAQHFGLASGAVTVASGGGEPHAEMTTQFSFLQDHFMPVHHHASPASGPAAGDYNLNFSMSSGLVGVNSRGTLQSNSQPHISGHHHHHQHHQQLHRLSTPLDTPNNIPFLFSPAAAAAPAAAESQFAAFQLWNGGFQHADMKEKGKN